MIKKLSKKASLLSALVLTMALFGGCSNEKENKEVADIEVKTIATKESGKNYKISYQMILGL